MEHLPAEAAEALMKVLPEHIRTGIINHAASIEYPIEAVIEMAIAGFLDDDCLNFTDCKPPHIRRTPG